MAKRQKSLKHTRGQTPRKSTETHVDQGTLPEQHINPIRNTSMPPTSDSGDGISEGSVYDASGAATGGGVDISDAVEKSAEAEVQKQKPLHQGSSAYSGGGADNGSNL